MKAIYCYYKESIVALTNHIFAFALPFYYYFYVIDIMTLNSDVYMFGPWANIICIFDILFFLLRSTIVCCTHCIWIISILFLLC